MVVEDGFQFDDIPAFVNLFIVGGLSEQVVCHRMNQVAGQLDHLLLLDRFWNLCAKFFNNAILSFGT